MVCRLHTSKFHKNIWNHLLSNGKGVSPSSSQLCEIGYDIRFLLNLVSYGQVLINPHRFKVMLDMLFCGQGFSYFPHSEGFE